MCDITDKEFEKIYLPFYNNVNNYLNNYVIPDLVAFYLANGYSRHCLSDCPLRNHINSAIDVFNWGCDISRLIPKVKEILKIKYNLIIIKDNPMILKKYCWKAELCQMKLIEFLNGWNCCFIWYNSR